MLMRFYLRMSFYAGMLAVLLVGLVLIVAPTTDIVALGSSRHIYLFDVSRRFAFNLTQHLDTYAHINPSWSPDGTALVMQVSEKRDSPPEDQVMYTIAANGQHSTRLDAHIGGVVSPRWSPQDDAIIFWSFRDLHIHWLSLETGESRNLTRTSDVADLISLHPFWSPDGQHILLTVSQRGKSDIYRLDIDSGSATPLTDELGSDQLPLWSPDGRLITFISNREGDYEDIFLMNADGTNLRRLTDNPAREFVLSWSPDSRKIAYRSVNAGQAQFRIHDVTTGKSTPLIIGEIDEGWYSLAWQPD